MSDSFKFMDDSPPVVKTKEDIIGEIMEHLKILLQNQISSILAACRPKQPIRSFERDDNSKKAVKGAIRALHHSYRDAKIKRLQKNPTGLKDKLYELFNHIKPHELLTKETLEGIPKEVIDNFVKIKNAKLHRGAESKVPTANWFKEFDPNTMSEQDKKNFFVEFQKKELLRLIDVLNLAKIEDANIERIKICITTHGLSYSFADILLLIHKYIEYKYSIAAPPITTSAALLAFIHAELPVLSAIMTPYYGASKDFIDFIIYLPLLRIYIRLILMESGISVAGDSATVANLLVDIIRNNLCHFVKIAGDPDIVIRISTLGDVIIRIEGGVNDFLQYAVPGTVDQGAAQGGNRRRIKKYKNRTSRRSSRRSSRRTNRVTKYRTNRYKMKNKKTRKT